MKLTLSNGRFHSGIIACVAITMFGAAATPAEARDESTIRVGIVTFLTGPAAAAPGIPGGNGARLIIDAINEGTLPAPFDTKGLGGRRIEAVFVDETGGPTRQVSEFRNLVQRRDIDLVVGYITVADCNAIAPVADELKILTVLVPCGTLIFEEQDFKYAFQAINGATVPSVAAARFIKERFPDARTFAGINPNYAFGRDNWRTFMASMRALDPRVEAVNELWPKLFAGQYGTETTTLLIDGPDVIHSALWGGDMQAFIIQAAPRELFERSRLLMAVGLHVLPLIGNHLPDGSIVTTLGPYGRFMPKSAISDWFIREYAARYGSPYVVAASMYADAMLGVKAAFDKATALAARAPTMEEVVAALEGLEWNGLTGPVRMANGNGHQAITGTAVGYSYYDAAEGQTVVRDLVRFDAECVNPPPGWKSLEWIEAGFPGAKCD